LKIRSILILAAAAALTAQEIGYNATNTMRFGLGREWAGTEKNVEVEKQYFEDWLDLEVFKGNFTAGIRYEAADISSNNESLNEVTKVFFNYSDRGINLTAGDFYGSFGRGLVLGLKDSKADFFDSKITGGKFEYCGDYLGFKALGGKSYFKYINDFYPAAKTVETMNNNLLGSELTIPLSTYLGSEDIVYNLGGSYLYMKGDTIPENQYLYSEMFIKETSIGAFTFEFSGYDLEFFNEYAIKTTQRTPSQTGWANYTSLNYSTKGLSIGLEFKDYYKYGANPNDQSSGFTPYQIAPELIIVHSSHLLNTHPHQVNPNDEIGYKLSAMYQPAEKIDISGTFAFSSKHNEDGIIPEKDDTYLPYLDSWLSFGYTQENYGLTFGAGYFLDSPLAKGVNKLIAPGSDTGLIVYSDNRITFTGEYTLKLNGNSKTAFCGEFQTASNEYLDAEYNDMYLSAEYSYLPVGYLNVSLITTAEKLPGDPWYSFVEDVTESWFGVEAGINIKENHKLEIFYGRERAGVKCAGGTCRQVPEFDGLRLTLVSDL
jgi:hypothetical protein